MKTKLLLLITGFMVFTFISSLKAQNVFSEVIYDSLGSTGAYSVALDFDNGFIIAGEANSGGMFLKIDSAGGLLWSKRINNGVSQSYNCIISTNDSSFVLAGVVTDGMLVTKIDANGDTLWNKIIIDSCYQVTSVQQTMDSGYIISGIVSSYFTPNSKIDVVKLDYMGNRQWSFIFTGGNNTNYGNSIKQTPDSGYILIGYVANYPPYDPNSFLMKLTSNGAVVWSKKYNHSPSTNCNGFGIEVTANGFLCFLAVNNGLVVMKTDYLGNILWSKAINNFGGGDMSKIHKITDNSFLISEGGFLGSALINVDSSGNVVWSKYLEIIEADAIASEDSGILIIGNGPLWGMRMLSTYNPQIGIIKTDSLGNSTNCVSSAMDFAIIDTLISANVSFVSTAGGSINQYTYSINIPSFDLESGCVSRLSGINETNSENGITIFPNPTSDKINFSFSHVSKKAELSIVNILGEKVFFKKLTGDETKHFSITHNFPAGVYTVVLQDKNDVYAKKLVIE